jgi:starch-binding outer membrane protein, SusD/RagB family
MKIINKRIRTLQFKISFLFIGVLMICGCEKFMDIPLPTNSVSGDGVFQTDNTTGAVVTGVLSGFYNDGTVFSGTGSIGFQTGLYTDELQNLVSANVSNQAFYINNIRSTDVSQWRPLYRAVYSSNLAISGIRKSTSNLLYRNQWLGESLFCRAYLYYYIVNMFGNAPLAIVPDVITNNQLSRNPKNEIYQQIIADLKEAKSMLTKDYKNGLGLASTSRSRPNLHAVSALLARAYLETGDWTGAEAEAASIIDNAALYQLVAPAQAFLSASKETIWAIAPTGTTGFVREFSLYNGGAPASVNAITGSNSLGTYGISTALTDAQLALYDQTNDLRFASWIRPTVVTSVAKTYYFPNKYKSNIPGTEFVVAFRLAEQYLIRAEARARLNNLDGAKTDLEAIRNRAGLTTPITAVTQTEVISAILNERRMELFTEFGFRFIDLKRTGNIDAVMTVVAPQKGGAWNSLKQVWPIPVTDITANPNLTQTPGYDN